MKSFLKQASSFLAAMSFAYAGISLVENSHWAVWMTAIVVGVLLQEWYGSIVHDVRTEEERPYKDGKKY